MSSRSFLILAATCCVAPAHAQSCPELYSSIKREAMYCDFFCDQRRLLPLQMAYEKSCIVFVLPQALLAFENPPPDIMQRKTDTNEAAGLTISPE